MQYIFFLSQYKGWLFVQAISDATPVATPFPVMSPLLLSKTVGRRERTISCCTLICSYFQSQYAHRQQHATFFFLGTQRYQCTRYNQIRDRRYFLAIFQSYQVRTFGSSANQLDKSFCTFLCLYSNPLVESWNVKLVTGNIALALVVITGLKHHPGDGTVHR